MTGNGTSNKTVEIVLNAPMEELAEAGLDERALEILVDFSRRKREERRKRQADGIAAAKANGVRVGRPVAEMPENFEQIALLWESRAISLDAALGLCCVSSSTFFRWLRRRKENMN